MVRGCASAHGIMGNCHICEGSINAERFWSNVRCHPDDVFFEDVRAQFSETRPACVKSMWLRSKRVQVLDWPICSPDMSPIENVCCIMKHRVQQQRPHTEVVYWARMRKNFIFRNSSVLSSQRLTECCLKTRRCIRGANTLLSQFYWSTLQASNSE